MSFPGNRSMTFKRSSLLHIAAVIVVASSVARSQQLQHVTQVSTDAAASGTEKGIAAPVPLVLILDPTGDGALSVKSAAGLNVPAGAIQVNSTAFCGVSLSGPATMSALQTGVVGGACFPAESIAGPVLEGADVVVDPLAGVLPTVADWNAFKASLPMPAGPTGAITASGTYNPGYYPEGLNAGSGAVIILNPGTYMFGNHVKLGAGANVFGNGVTICLDQGVELDMSGRRTTLFLTPPDAGAFFGITLFTHRQSTGSSVCKFGSGVILEGIVYVPGGELVIANGKEIGSIIAWQASISGKTGLVITGVGVPPL